MGKRWWIRVPVRLFSYLLKEGDAQEYPDNDAHQNQEPVHEACAQFRFLVQVLGYVILEDVYKRQVYQSKHFADKIPR